MITALNSEIGHFETSIRLVSPDQCREVSVPITARISVSELIFCPSAVVNGSGGLDFGSSTPYTESRQLTLTVTNPGFIPLGFGFVDVPEVS